MGGGVAVLDPAVVAAAEQLAVGPNRAAPTGTPPSAGTGPGLLERDGEHGGGTEHGAHVQRECSRVPETARGRERAPVVEKALDRTIAGCRRHRRVRVPPAPPRRDRQALKGGRLVAAHRRGKTMWCDTGPPTGTPGPRLGIHLGMGGRIFVTDPTGDAAL